MPVSFTYRYGGEHAILGELRTTYGTRYPVMQSNEIGWRTLSLAIVPKVSGC